METQVIVVVVALVLSVLFGGAALYFYFRSSNQSSSNLKALMHSSQAGGGFADKSVRGSSPAAIKGQLESLKKKQASAGEEITLERKFFQAGMFYEEDKKEFYRLRTILPVIGIVVGGALGAVIGGIWMVAAIALCGLVGYQLPTSILDRKILNRSEDIMFYLPLVIEQIIIGVSSSLDVGPCLARVVQMADERDSHNSVTELIRYAQLYMKTGISLDEALTEVGKLSGHTELKHSFMSLAQVAKHGGEITRQLQELADAVSTQRETRIDAKIKKLELAATGPVGLVFVGFLVILLTGFGIQIMKAFK